MANKTYTIKISGDSDAVTGGLDSFARAHGWVDQIIDNETGDIIDNPVTKPEFSEEVIKNFLKKSIKRWNMEQAKMAAQKAAGEAVEEALSVVSVSLEE